MKWYEQKFLDFFNKWKKGDLYLQNGQGYFGEVESIEFADKFEDSTIRFICYQRSVEEKTFTLSEIRHFRANSGSVLNISKYVKIVKLREQSHLSLVDREKEDESKEEASTYIVRVDAEPFDKKLDDEEENKVFCLVFGLEFYTTEKRARILKKDVNQFLLSRLGNTTPLLSMEEHGPIDLTPTFSKWILRWFRVLKSRSKKNIGKHSSDRGQEWAEDKSDITKERNRT